MSSATFCLKAKYGSRKVFSNTGFDSVACAATFAANAKVIKNRRNLAGQFDCESLKQLAAPTDLRLNGINQLAFNYRSHLKNLPWLLPISVVYQAAVEVGLQNLGFAQVCCRNLEQIVVQHNECCALAWFE